MGGISANTSSYILYGTSGFLTVNAVDLGATLGDISLEMGTEEYYPDLAQARGPLVGTGKIVGASGKITVTLAEWNFAVLKTLFSSGYSSDASSEVIGSGALGTITELTNVVITGLDRNDGKAFVATIPHARVTSPIATTLAETSESGIEITFEALFTATAPATMPIWVKFEV